MTPGAPRNLLLQAGSLEGRFAANAQELLAQAGSGEGVRCRIRARRLTVIPNAEHISILFRGESHTRRWIGWRMPSVSRV